MPIDALDSVGTLSFLFSPVSPALSARDMVKSQKTQWFAFLAIRGFCDCSFTAHGNWTLGFDWDMRFSEVPKVPIEVSWSQIRNVILLARGRTFRRLCPTVQGYSMSVSDKDHSWTSLVSLQNSWQMDIRKIGAELMLLTMLLRSLGVSHVHFGSNTRSEASHSDEVSSRHLRNTFLGWIPRFRKVVNWIQDMDIFTTKIDCPTVSFLREQKCDPLKCADGSCKSTRLASTSTPCLEDKV